MAFTTLVTLSLLILFYSIYNKPLHAYDNRNDTSSCTVGSELAILPWKTCYRWCHTRDKKLRNLIFPPCHCFGLMLQLDYSNLHIFLCLLLSGDICVNPGPVGFTRSVQSRTQPSNLQNILLVKFQVCNLSLLQELVYADDSDLGPVHMEVGDPG